MRVPIFPVLGAFLFVAVFGPFVLMFAGPALTRDPESARIGLYLLLNVNPVAIPSLLFLLGVAWACRLWTASSARSRPVTSTATPSPASPVRTARPAAVASKRRATRHGGEVIDAVAVRVHERPVLRGHARPSTAAAPYPAIAFQARKDRALGGRA